MIRDHDRLDGALAEVEEGGDASFSAPLGDVTSGQILFTHGTPPGLTIRGDDSLDELFVARLGQPLPEVGVDGGAVTLEYPRFSRTPPDHAGIPGSIGLNCSIPWQIEIRGGGSRLTADLGALQITEIDLAGGIADARLILPRQFGATPIRISGGISHLTILRPEGVGVRVDVSGGVAMMTLDELTIDAVGELRLKSTDYDSSTDRYDIRICGGVGRLTIATIVGRGS